MELKLTTKRALEYEERTGRDLLEVLGHVSKVNTIKISETIDLFKALGEGYDEDVFDAWEAPLKVKIEKIIAAVKEYVVGKNV